MREKTQITMRSQTKSAKKPQIFFQECIILSNPSKFSSFQVKTDKVCQTKVFDTFEYDKGHKIDKSVQSYSKMHYFSEFM